MKAPVLTPLEEIRHAAELASAWLQHPRSLDVCEDIACASASLTNGERVPRLFQRFYASDAYTCFVLGVPILERAIGELVMGGVAREETSIRTCASP